ncbi:MAG: PD-(D/E)XK nuclease family transposase [Candidatus Eremiobacteraeota bacterium]|nr:PD-(D/E)XK nuclease family transposase [Candidatus Eremiobacteraeota bacterium]
MRYDLLSSRRREPLWSVTAFSTISYSSIYRFLEIHDQDELPETLEVHFIELGKFKDRPVRELSTPLERWLHLLKFSEHYATMERELPPELAGEEGIAMAVEAYRKSKADARLKALMDFREKAEHDHATWMKEAEHKVSNPTYLSQENPS